MTRLRSSNLVQPVGEVDPAVLAATRDRYLSGAWTRRVIRPLLLALLTTSLAVGMITVIRLIAQDARWNLMLPLLFIIALETVYTTLWLNHPDRLSLNRGAYRAAELVLILLVVRVVTWVLFVGAPPTLDEVLLYLRNPFAFFLQGAFIVGIFLAVIVWRVALSLSDIFSRLALSEYEIRFFSLPLAVRKARIEDQPIAAGRSELTRSFARVWIWGGMLLLLATGLSSFDLGAVHSDGALMGITRLGLDPLLLVALLFYFLSGFWLLSQARLESMNARWLINDVVKDPAVERLWQRGSLLILLLIALVAAFMPIGSSFALGQVVSALLYVGLFIANLIFYLMALLIMGLWSLLGGTSSEALNVEPPLPAQQATEPPFTPTPLGDTAAFVASSAFWALFIVVAVTAVLFFLRERGYSLSREQLRQAWRWLVDGLKRAWARFIFGAQALRFDLSARLRLPRRNGATAGGAQKQRRWPFLRINALSPREQIRYFYLSAVRRAGDRGVQRGESETPLEYEEDLKTHWPAAEEQVTRLTEAFLKARYSDRSITDDDLPDVKATWKQVRANLRQQPQSPDAPADADAPPSENSENLP